MNSEQQSVRRLPVRSPPTWPCELPGELADLRKLVASRYRELGPEPYWFARLKLLLDPMFGRLLDLVGATGHLLDLGAGYGVPAVWLLAHHPELRVTAVESDARRAQIAAWAMGERGTVHCLQLPRLPRLPAAVDRILLIDVIHYVSDELLKELLTVAARALSPSGRVVLRDTVPSRALLPWERALESWRLRQKGIPARFRSADALVMALERAGLSAAIESTSGREATWLVAQKAV
ncbi:SAM-dependent methyltransferase [Myxococcota bacterium]